MDKNDCYFLGKVTKAIGLKGEVTVYLDTNSPERYIELESVFIELNDELVPFFIEDLHLKPKNTAIVTFEDIATPEKANILIDCDLYMPLSSLPPLTGKAFYYHEVVGFNVIDKNKGSIGKIDSVIDSAASPIFSIFQESTEILIPAVNDFIVRIDRNNQTIEIDAPEGLIDIYLEKKNQITN